jgi:hypothetical protein
VRQRLNIREHSWRGNAQLTQIVALHEDRSRPLTLVCPQTLVRRLVDARPTYGYRRITALLNRDLAAEGLAAANHKRV